MAAGRRGQVVRVRATLQGFLRSFQNQEAQGGGGETILFNFDAPCRSALNALLFFYHRPQLLWSNEGRHFGWRQIAPGRVFRGAKVEGRRGSGQVIDPGGERSRNKRACTQRSFGAAATGNAMIPAPFLDAQMQLDKRKALNTLVLTMTVRFCASRMPLRGW